MYSSENIRNAMRIYYYLLQYNELKHRDDAELYQLFSSSEVSEILKIFEDVSGVLIRKFDDTIYLFPNTDNDFLGYKRVEIKREIFGRSDVRNIDLYLAMYIMIVLTSEYYSGTGSNIKLREFIDLGTLNQILTERLELFRNEEQSNINQTGIAIREIAKHWFDLIDSDDDIAVRSRKWYIKQVLKFLEKENLVNITDETIIYPSLKFNRLAANYFLNYNRLKDIETLFNEVGGIDVAED